MTALSLRDIQEQLVSHSERLGWFDHVAIGDIESAPAGGLVCAWTIDGFVPDPSTSGLNTTSVIVIATARIYRNQTAHPNEGVPVAVLEAVDDFIESLHTDLKLDRDDSTVDLFGFGQNRMGANAGLLEFNGTIYRFVDVTIPILVKDVWTQQN